MIWCACLCCNSGCKHFVYTCWCINYLDIDSTCVINEWRAFWKRFSCIRYHFSIYTFTYNITNGFCQHDKLQVNASKILVSSICRDISFEIFVKVISQIWRFKGFPENWSPNISERTCISLFSEVQIIYVYLEQKKTQEK